MTETSKPQKSREQRKAERRAQLPPETPTQRAQRLQRTNTREQESLRVIEKGNRNLGKLSLILVNAPPADATLIAQIVVETNREKDQEIIRLRRALVRSQIRLERTTASLLPRLKSKAKEVRELRAKLNPDTNSEGSRVTRRRAKILGVKLKGAEPQPLLLPSESILPPLDKILDANRKAAADYEHVQAR